MKSAKRLSRISAKSKADFTSSLAWLGLAGSTSTEDEEEEEGSIGQVSLPRAKISVIQLQLQLRLALHVETSLRYIYRYRYKHRCSGCDSGEQVNLKQSRCISRDRHRVLVLGHGNYRCRVPQLAAPQAIYLYVRIT